MSTSKVVPLNTKRFFSNVENQIDREGDLRLAYDAIGIHELENVLRSRIVEFQLQSGKGGKHGYGYRALTAAIESALYKSLEKKGLDLEAIEKVIDKRVPSHTYIRNFKEGQNICINYMNTLAFFFDVKYLVNNFELE